LEGVVAKRADSVYEPGRRSLAWQKLPRKPKQEFVIGGYRPEGSALELILVGYYEKNKLLFAAKEGDDFCQGMRAGVGYPPN
jgi:bifunctional non-homologous end joining protein LigD